MYQKVVIPWDGSAEAQGVLPHVRDEVEAEGEVVFLRVVAPARMKVVEDETRAAIQTSCELAFRDRVEDGIRWTCDAAVSSDVVTGILDYSDANNVDLIAMYTRDRKGLAALRKKSIAKEVRKKASIEVKVFKPGEVVGAT